MRWRETTKSGRRFRRGFLFTPKRIGGEFRWLEFAVWGEKWFSDGFSNGWRNHRWVSDKHERGAK